MIRPTRRQVSLAGAILAAAGLASPGARAEAFEVVRSDEEWRRLLTPTQYSVLRQAQTERAGTSPLDREKRAGTYHCAGCEQALFSSTTKFDSGTGWPSFWQPLDGAIATRSETFFFIKQTEVHCHRCGGHLGHVFNDGPRPTGLRYCMNGVAMVFKPTAVRS